MPKTNDTADKFFNAINEASEALLDAVKSANDRTYRVSRQLLDELERGQREAIELSRKLASEPRDVSALYSATVRSITDGQGRALDLTRQLLDEVSDGQREGRDVFRRVIEANRSAGQAAVEATREVVTNLGTRATSAVQSVRTRATNGRTVPAATKAKSKAAAQATSDA